MVVKARVRVCPVCSTTITFLYTFAKRANVQKCKRLVLQPKTKMEAYYVSCGIKAHVGKCSRITDVLQVHVLFYGIVLSLLLAANPVPQTKLRERTRVFCSV